MIGNRESLTHLMSRAIHYSVSDGVPYRSGCVALVVGTILNLIWGDFIELDQDNPDLLSGGGIK